MFYFLLKYNTTFKFIKHTKNTIWLIRGLLPMNKCKIQMQKDPNGKKTTALKAYMDAETAE